MNYFPPFFQQGYQPQPYQGNSQPPNSSFNINAPEFVPKTASEKRERVERQKQRQPYDNIVTNLSKYIELLEKYSTVLNKLKKHLPTLNYSKKQSSLYENNI